MIDECHRGSAAEDSAWREILDYYSTATQIGLTATPKETCYVSNIHYFGQPLYTYSLRQGIEDGFLAPYKVVRIDLDKDLTGWRPERGKRDKHGREIEDRVYNQRDFDRNLALDQRTQLVAQKITEFLKGTDRYQKTIVFCEDIDHAERMRQALVNENADLVAEDPRYVMRITGDNDEGKAQLDFFIDPESRYPVIAVTSRLMGTRIGCVTTLGGAHTVRLRLTALPEMHPCLLWHDILAAATAVLDQDAASRSYPVFLQIHEIPGYGSGEVYLEIVPAGVSRGDVAKVRRTYENHRSGRTGGDCRCRSCVVLRRRPPDPRRFTARHIGGLPDRRPAALAGGRRTFSEERLFGSLERTLAAAGRRFHWVLCFGHRV